MKNAMPPGLSDEEIRARRALRRTWYGPLADDNVEEIVARFRRLLSGQYYTVITNNADYDFEMPEVKVSQFLTPSTTTYGEKHDGIRHHRIGDPTNVEWNGSEKTWSSCGVTIVDSYGVYGISSTFATEREAYDAWNSNDISRRRWVTYLAIEGGYSDDPREVSSKDRIEITQYNLVSPPQQLQWIFAPERHWDNYGPDQYKKD